MSSKSLLQKVIGRSIYAAPGGRRLPFIRRFSFICALLVVLSPGLRAQEPATSLAQINMILGKGDKITLVDSSGDASTGRVNRVGSDGLDLTVGDSIRTFTEDDIRQITRAKPDSPLNGFLIGAGTAFGLTLPLNLAITGKDEAGFAVAASMIWGLMGGGIGALVDAFVHGEQLVYFRPRSTVSWNISPIYSGFPAQSPKPGLHAFPGDLASGMGVKHSKGIRVTVRF